MAVYGGVSGVNRELSAVQGCVGNVNRALSGFQACVGGVNRDLISTGYELQIAPITCTWSGFYGDLSAGGNSWERGVGFDVDQATGSITMYPFPGVPDYYYGLSMYVDCRIIGPAGPATVTGTIPTVQSYGYGGSIPRNITIPYNDVLLSGTGGYYPGDGSQEIINTRYTISNLRINGEIPTIIVG